MTTKQSLRHRLLRPFGARNDTLGHSIDILVIGAGFAGLSTAYHLAKKGAKNIVVIEQEDKLGGHASGRNAGMIRQAISDPVTARLACKGRRALESLRRQGWKNLGYFENGSLLLAKGKGIGELKKIETALKKQGLASRWLSKEQAVRMVSVLKNADFETGLFCPTDAMIEIDALLKGFLNKLQRQGVNVFCGCKVQSIRRSFGGFLVKAGRKVFLTNKIVNAAGGWAGLVGEKGGASKIPLKAYRRHLFTSRPFASAQRTWPFVWDISHDVYFRPEEGKCLLLSPCDKTAVTRQYAAACKEEIDPRIKRVLVEKLNCFSGQFKGIKIASVKSGLRTMTPDGRFAIGEDPKLKGFFWVAGLGGHGVTTSFSVGDLASDLILGKKADSRLAKAMSPARFL